MKKYLPVVFLFVLWCAWEAVTAPERLILVGGFAAAGTLLHLRWRAAPWCAALAVCIGFCVYVPGFLRYIPVFLLSLARRICMEQPSNKKKNASGNESVYTVLLIAVSVSVVILIYDIVHSAKNIRQFVPVRQYWWLCGAALVFAAVLFLGRGAARRQKGAFGVYSVGLVGLLFAAVGFLCNSGLYALADAVFPWLLFLAAAAAQPDKVLAAAAENALSAIGRFASGREGA